MEMMMKEIMGRSIRICNFIGITSNSLPHTVTGSPPYASLFQRKAMRKRKNRHLYACRCVIYGFIVLIMLSPLSIGTIHVFFKDIFKNCCILPSESMLALAGEGFPAAADIAQAMNRLAPCPAPSAPWRSRRHPTNGGSKSSYVLIMFLIYNLITVRYSCYAHWN